MARKLNLADIQGNILRGYGLPIARFIFLNIQDSAEGRVAGREFVDTVRFRVTNALPWDTDAKDYPRSPLTGKEALPVKPQVTLNIAFTFWGLVALGLPTNTLQSMPAEFIEGMKARANLLGDELYPPKKPDPADTLNYWDPIWRNDDRDKQVHILISLNAQMNQNGTPVAELQKMTQWILDLCTASKGRVTALAGHGLDNKALYQDTSGLLALGPDGKTMVETPKEHFGFTDGFGDPVFDGQYPADLEMKKAIGGGKILPDQTWKPLATGEFLLGYPDEAQEVPPASMPLELTRNGTFMAYRKMHQNVLKFRKYLKEEAVKYAKINGISNVTEAEETIKAKIVGRWSDGVPLMAAPTFAEWQAFKARQAAAIASKDAAAIDKINQSYVDFKYRTDPQGSKCPVTAHMRRANTRDSLDPTGTSPDPKHWNGSVLNNRRRILRRGNPYGPQVPESAETDGEQGIIFLALCTSLFRQFEFVQQQWMQYGLDFDAGNDTCPLIGNHGEETKFVIPGGGDGGEKPGPYICSRLPQFIEIRGGAYFFVPSMTALRMIAMGTVDPT
jgi:Dyp-type peroxidase family